MEQRLGRDVFLALAAVGWADGKLDEDEADAIVRTALEEGLDLDEITSIEEATKKPVDIGTIDLSSMSKADRLFVYAVAAWMARIDGVVADKERQALDKLGEALRLPERPRQYADDIAREIGQAAASEAPAFFNLPKLRRTLKVRLQEAQALRAAKSGDDEAE
ncbi:MAG: TerB family tellurite resistance protein [Myxococcales bacterium]|nr:TerB family tellurite resistance protein [Myxococcales bacterium]